MNFNPDLIIASGLYVYHDDASVKQSLQKLSNLLASGKKILVDNQIDNPSRKLMEKVCKTTKGEAWELFYRTEEHIKSLMNPYFRDINSIVDKWAIYSLAVGIKK